MRMKRVLLASSALALLAGAQEAQADGLYISVFGGVNLQADSDATLSLPSTAQFVDPDTGFVLGGAIGAKLTNWAEGLRAEVEVSYRRNDLGGNWFTDADVPVVTDTTGGPIDGNLSTFAVMANIWYDFDFGWKVKPYIGGGAGWGRTKADGAFFTTSTNGTPTTGTRTTFNMSDSGFAWQLGLGLNYEASPGVDIGLGYRYFRGPDFMTFDNLGGEVGISPAVGGLDNENHSVMFNLNVDIN